ncbi:hypothetical protein, partial [Serratia marcescens]|uniref:hypothetical protein n=1 Tax=Serratia marcescens TaxID=615 RepID=UPI001953D80B
IRLSSIALAMGSDMKPLRVLSLRHQLGLAAGLAALAMSGLVLAHPQPWAWELALTRQVHPRVSD